MSESHATQRLGFLYEAARILSSSLDTDHVLQMLMMLTQQHFRPDAVSVALVDEDGTLVFRAASGQKAQDVLGLRLEQGTGIVGWVAQHGQALWVPDTAADARHYRQVDRDTGFHTRAIYAVPVKMGDQTLAVLELINPSAAVALDELREVIPALAALAAPAIQNARLFEQARRAEERYQRLFDLTLDPILILDRQGRLLHVNRAGRQFHDLLTRQGEATSLWDALHVPAEAATSTDDAHVTTWELELPTSDDNPAVYEISLAYLRSYPPAGAYQILAHDVTDRVTLEKTREMLSLMIVHDLRNPLNTILHTLELILTSWEEGDSDLPIGQIARLGLRNAKRMDRLISDILDTARLPQDATITLAPTDVREIVREAVEAIRPSANWRRHTLTYEVIEPLLPLKSDTDMLRRILINLLGNAVKFTPPGGHIHVRVQPRESDYLFAISDTGPGIPSEEQQHIFDPFYQGHEGRKQRRGSGMGLAFCKLAVEAHQGRIWVESVPAQGTTFYFTIPR